MRLCLLCSAGQINPWTLAKKAKHGALWSDLGQIFERKIIKSTNLQNFKDFYHVNSCKVHKNNV